MKIEVTDINLSNWSRLETYKLFRQSDFPFFDITANIDVTPMMKIGKPAGLPIFNFTLFGLMKAINSIPEFKTRFENDRVYEVSVTSPSFTVPINEDGFAFCEVPFDPRWEKFNADCTARIEAAKQQTELKENAGKSLHWTYLSCMPWVSFTSAGHPMFDVNDCIPRIAWGKIDQVGDRWKMPLNLQAHHALMDGFHAGLFFKRAEENLADFPS